MPKLTRSTTNPAWCLYDMLSNERYGFGMPDAVLEQAKHDLVPLSQYCDGIVPDGQDGRAAPAIEPPSIDAETRYEPIEVQSSARHPSTF